MTSKSNNSELTMALNSRIAFLSTIVKIHLKIPYEIFRGRIPNIDFLHVFGCPVYIHKHKDYLGKFDEKADDGYFLGYSLVSKGFRVFNTRKQQTEETYHITFDESTDPIKFSKSSVDNINIAEFERYPPDEYLHHYEPSQKYQIKQSKRGISIYHEKYVKDLLKKYDINGSSVKTPMVPPYNLGPDLNDKSINETQFRGFDLKGYSDSDYVRCNMDRKSTLGACQLLGGKLVCWSAKKQECVAMSSAEAEYVAVAGCCANILWMKS
ncbi:retrovirus-related pol polyprotein from transposon TNT 1-94 [Tanacetum coccineum]